MGVELHINVNISIHIYHIINKWCHECKVLNHGAYLHLRHDFEVHHADSSPRPSTTPHTTRFGIGQNFHQWVNRAEPFHGWPWTLKAGKVLEMRAFNSAPHEELCAFFTSVVVVRICCCCCCCVGCFIDNCFGMFGMYGAVYFVSQRITTSAMTAPVLSIANAFNS